MDLAIFRCVTHDRMETIKNETYGNKCFNKMKQMRKMKMNLGLLLHVYL